MDKVTKNQPNDDRQGGDAVMVDLCWKNQDEEKDREDGKNGELDTHSTGESLKVPTLKTGARVGACTKHANMSEYPVQRTTPSPAC